MNKNTVQRIIPIGVVIALLFLSAGGVLAQDETLLYMQNFEEGQADEWVLDPGWEITETESGYVLAGQGHVWARLGSGAWTDYRLRFKVRLTGDTALHANFRVAGPIRYFIGLSRGGLYLEKQTGPDSFSDHLANAQGLGNGWQDIEISGYGPTIRVSVNEQVAITYTDPEPLLSGGIAFESLTEAQVLIDDVEIWGPVPLPTPTMEGGIAWVRTGGPLGGLGYDIRMQPDNPDVMYVTDAWAGVHKSADGGLTWVNINKGIDARTGPSGDAIPVFCLTIDPNNYEIIWIGLQNLGGVYRSGNGGQTWERRTQGIEETDGLTIRGISVEPGNSEVVYIAGEISSWRWAGGERWGREFDRTMGVVYKSTDGGLNWSAVWRGDNLARYIWIEPENANIIYVSTGIFDREAANSDPETGTAGGVGILRSVDGGQTWEQVNTGLRNLYTGSLFMHPNDSQILLAGAGNNAYPEGGGVYLTTDGGENWRHVAGQHITSVEFAAANPEIAYAAGSGEFFRSEDGGKSWKQLVHPRGWGWGPDGIRPGFPIDIQVDPRNPDRIFVNNYGGGNFLSEDGGQNWISASTGYTGADLTDIFVDPSNPAVVYVNGRSGPFVSYDGGHIWQGLNPMEVREITEGARITLDPVRPDHILLSAAGGGLTYESMDSGHNWQLVSDYNERLLNLPYDNINQKYQGLWAITFAPSDPSVVYGGFGTWRCATDADPAMCDTVTLMGILISTDGGRNWSIKEATPLDGLTVTEILVHPQDANIAWAATAGGGVFKTIDQGDTWSARSNGLSANMVMDLAYDPTDPEILYAGTAARAVYKSVDGGQSWQESSAGMDPNEDIGALVVDPLHTTVVYAGSWRSGVYMSKDAGQSWHLINEGLRTRSVRALAISADGGTLYAGTRGEGVFRLDLSGQPPEVAVPTPAQLGIVLTTEPEPPAVESPEESNPSTPCLGGLAPIALIVTVSAWRRKIKE